MSNPPQNKTESFSLPTANGSTITAVYVERKVKVFAVHEPELDNISYLNTISLLIFSTASFLLSVAVKDGFNSDVWSKQTTWVSIGLYILGAMALFIKKSIVKKIKDESTTMQ